MTKSIIEIIVERCKISICGAEWCRPDNALFTIRNAIHFMHLEFNYDGSMLLFINNYDYMNYSTVSKNEAEEIHHLISKDRIHPNKHLDKHTAILISDDGEYSILIGGI